MNIFKLTMITMVTFFALYTGTANAGVDVTFELAAGGQPAPSGQGLPAHSFSVSVSGGNEIKTCTILWNQTSCTISDMNNGETLIRVSWGRAQIGRAIQVVAFWANIQPADTTVQIPSSMVTIQTKDDISPWPGVGVYVRPSYEAVVHDRASLQTTVNAKNLGYKVTDLKHHHADNGVTLPMLGGCYSIAVHGKKDAAPSNITRVLYPKTNDLEANGSSPALCVSGNGDAVNVEVNAEIGRVELIETM